MPSSGSMHTTADRRYLDPWPDDIPSTGCGSGFCARHPTICSVGVRNCACLTHRGQDTDPGGSAHRLAPSPSRQDVHDRLRAGGPEPSLQISVDPRRLAPSKSAATRELALLVTAQRQAAGEDQTPVDEVRTATIEFGNYDAPIFSSAINELRGAFLVKGPPRQRVLEAHPHGMGQAADLVRELGVRT